MESTERSIVPRRVAGVSVALASAGAVLGAGLSAGLVALTSLVLREAGVTVPGGSVLAAAGVGAALGAVLTPMTALSLLRRVALGKALLFTMLGLAAGVAAVEVSTGQSVLSAGAGLGAFLIVALVLRATSGPRRKAPGRKTPQE